MLESLGVAGHVEVYMIGDTNLRHARGREDWGCPRHPLYGMNWELETAMIVGPHLHTERRV
jgi:hypothetical protein